VIVSWDELVPLRGEVAMVDGGFDPLHGGHVAYFEEAAGLNLPLLCNVASDEYVATKHPPLLPHAERGRVINALAAVSYVHLSQLSTAAVLRQLQPRFYVKGSDWSNRSLPPEEMSACDEFGIDVVLLDTVLNSSSGILDDFVKRSEIRKARA
jgi:cytidyltransferase-like protein